jgi:hypothetical protein
MSTLVSITKKTVLNILPMMSGSKIPEIIHVRKHQKKIIPPVGVQISMHIHITEY